MSPHEQGQTELKAEALVKAAGYHPLWANLVGSTYINGEGSDIDVVVLLPKMDGDTVEYSMHGWTYGGSNQPGDPERWASFKTHIKGKEWNLILTSDEEYAISWVRAAEACKALRLLGFKMTKRARVAVHAVIMDEADAEDEVKRVCGMFASEGVVALDEWPTSSDFNLAF